MTGLSNSQSKLVLAGLQQPGETSSQLLTKSASSTALAMCKACEVCVG